MRIISIIKLVENSDGRMLPVVYFNDNGSVVSDGVREALESLIPVMEQGNNFRTRGVYRKAGLWDGSTLVRKPTDDVHQTQDCICMHDFPPSPGFDPVPTNDVRQKIQSITLQVVAKNLQGIRNNDKLVDCLARLDRFLLCLSEIWNSGR